MKKSAFIAVFCCLLYSCASLPAVGDFGLGIPGSGSGNPISEADVIAGLREALQQGAKTSVSKASLQDGFYKNALLFIPFPPEAENVKKKALELGLDSQVSKFEETLNRAAEKASKEALNIFATAITEFTIQDGFTILKGADNAATQYLKGKTEAQLRVKFKPIVDKAVADVGLTNAWSPLATAYNAATIFTGGQAVEPDLTSYVTEKAISGLFVHVAAEEKRIRQDPLARGTELLQRVFSSVDR